LAASSTSSRSQVERVGKGTAGSTMNHTLVKCFGCVTAISFWRLTSLNLAVFALAPDLRMGCEHNENAVRWGVESEVCGVVSGFSACSELVRSGAPLGCSRSARALGGHYCRPHFAWSRSTLLPCHSRPGAAGAAAHRSTAASWASRRDEDAPSPGGRRQ
jgi:hypothetical protein